MFPMLPPEIMDVVCDFTGYQQDQWSSCSQVCWEWYHHYHTSSVLDRVPFVLRVNHPSRPLDTIQPCLPFVRQLIIWYQHKWDSYDQPVIPETALHCAYQLRYLVITTHYLSPEPLRCDLSMCPLETLRLRNCRLDDAGVTRILDCPSLQLSLRRLTLTEYHDVSGTRLVKIGQLQNLEQLVLGSTNLDTTGSTALASLHHLRELTLKYCNDVTDEGLRALLRAPALEKLNLIECRSVGFGSGVTSAAASARQLLKLRVVRCYAVQLTGFRCIARLPNLRELVLCGDNVVDGALRMLAGSPLQKLVLSLCYQVSDHGIAELRALPQLALLDVQRCELTGPGLSALHDHPNLETVRGYYVFRLADLLPKLSFTLEP